MYARVFLVALFLLVALSRGEGPRGGLCPSYRVKTMNNFDQSRFQGEWYVIQRNRDSDLSYTVINYSWNSDKRLFKMLPGQMFEAIGTIDLNELNKNSDNGRYLMSGNVNYNIMDTDYDSYAVVWTCKDLGKEHTQNLMVIARDRGVNAGSSDVLNNLLDGDTFDRSEIINVN